MTYFEDNAVSNSALSTFSYDPSYYYKLYVTKEIEKKDKEIEELKKSLEEENKKHNKKDDIYGDERKGGWFGSNILKR
jgi:hypothetical protein